MRFADVVATSAAVAATSSRTAKRDAIADLLGRLAPDEIAVAVGFLIGEPRQGRMGVGWNTLASVDVAPAHEPTLTIGDVDRTIDQLTVTTGSGSLAARRDLLRSMLERATAPEAEFFGQHREFEIFGDALPDRLLRWVKRHDEHAVADGRQSGRHRGAPLAAKK